MCVCESLIARHASGESRLTADIESHRLLASTGLSLIATPGKSESKDVSRADDEMKQKVKDTLFSLVSLDLKAASLRSL